MPAFVEQEKIDVAEQQSERVWVFGLLDSLRPIDPEQIRCCFPDEVFKQAALVRRLQRRQHRAIASAQHFDLASARQESTDDAPFRTVVRPKRGERIAVNAERKRPNRLCVELARKLQ